MVGRRANWMRPRSRTSLGSVGSLLVPGYRVVGGISFRRSGQGQPTMERCVQEFGQPRSQNPHRLSARVGRGGRDLQQRVRDYAKNRMATIPTYLAGSDCGMYSIGTDKSCELSGNGPRYSTQFTDTSSSVGLGRKAPTRGEPFSTTDGLQ